MRIFDMDGIPMDLKDRNKWVAVIGSRDATKEEMDAAYRLGYSLAKKGKIVVSGLAKGIDGAGHRGAIAGGGKTIALVSIAMTEPIYPPENKGLAEEIRKNGCIIYPYKTKAQYQKSGMSPKVRRLIERSILNAYVCPVIVVVKDSDAIITGGTKWATSYGKKLGHEVYRLDNSFTFHKDPLVEESHTWWIPEINYSEILKEMDTRI
jgi:DNA processing protein